MPDPAALPAIMPSANINGWTAARQRRFLEAIAEGYAVTVACGFVSLSTASAYAFRRRAAGQAFNLGWRAADLLARERVAADLMERARDGQLVETTRPDGSVTTRHYHDNRLALHLLARLDRYADASEATAAGQDARRIAADFDAYLDDIGHEHAPVRADPFGLADDRSREAADDGTIPVDPDPAATPATPDRAWPDPSPTPDRDRSISDPDPRLRRLDERRAPADADARSRQPVTTPAPTPADDAAPATDRSRERAARAETDGFTCQPVTTPGRGPALRPRLPWLRGDRVETDDSRQPLTTPDDDAGPRTGDGQDERGFGDDFPDEYGDEDVEEEFDVFDYRNYLPGAADRPEHAARPPVQAHRCDRELAP